MNALVAKTLEIAQSQLGVRETGGANRGPQVDGYLASIGLAPGAPWCAAFVYWCIDQAAQSLGVANPYLRSGYCPTVSVWAGSEDLLEDTPQPGDVFLLYTGRARHTGFVTGIDGTILRTVEGNTNINGSPEGIGVFQRRRSVSAKLRYVRWGRLADPAAADEVQLYVSGHALCSMPVNNGRSQCPVRTWGQFLGFQVDWDDDQQSVTFDGKPLDADLSLIDGTAYAPLRDLVAAAGLRVQSVGNGAVWVGR